MVTVVTKPIDFFHPDPKQPRKDFPEHELRDLGESLKKRQLVPVIVRKNGVLADGERRLRAAELVGLETLDAILIEDTAMEGEIREIQLITALHRSDLKPAEKFGGFVSWLETHPGKNGKDLAAAINCSEALVSMTLSLSKCIKQVREAAQAGQIGLKDWHAISQLAQEQQEAALTARLRGASVEEIKRSARKPSNNVRTSRVKCAMPSGVTVTLAGDGLTLDDVIQTLAELLKAAKKANDDGLDSKTFQAVLKDKAKAG